MRGLIINGPNLNMLGKRNKDHYGSLTLDEINNLIINKFNDISFDFYQTNHEGEIIDLLQNLVNYDFVVLNAGGYSHTSVAIKDALELVNIPIGICHLSDISKREPFRQVDLLKDSADVYIKGLQEKSYIETIKKLLKIIGKKEN